MTSTPEPEHRGILDKLGIKGLLRRVVSRFRSERRLPERLRLPARNYDNLNM